MSEIVTGRYFGALERGILQFIFLLSTVKCLQPVTWLSLSPDNFHPLEPWWDKTSFSIHLTCQRMSWWWKVHVRYQDCMLFIIFDACPDLSCWMLMLAWDSWQLHGHATRTDPSDDLDRCPTLQYKHSFIGQQLTHDIKTSYRQLILQDNEITILDNQPHEY